MVYLYIGLRSKADEWTSLIWRRAPKTKNKKEIKNKHRVAQCGGGVGAEVKSAYKSRGKNLAVEAVSLEVVVLNYYFGVLVRDPCVEETVLLSIHHSI